MSSLSQAKVLGGVGAILTLVSFVSPAGVLGIVGLVLILVSIKYISDIINDKNVFNNMIIAVLASIAGIIIGALVIFASLLRFVGFGYLFGLGTPPRFNGDFLAFAGSIILGLIALWIALIISAIYIRRSYDTIASRLNVDMFRTVALLYLIGAALTIVLVGLIIVFVAEILQVVAFFSIPDQLPQQTQVQ